MNGVMILRMYGGCMRKGVRRGYEAEVNAKKVLELY